MYMQSGDVRMAQAELAAAAGNSDGAAALLKQAHDTGYSRALAINRNHTEAMVSGFVALLLRCCSMCLVRAQPTTGHQSQPYRGHAECVHFAAAARL